MTKLQEKNYGEELEDDTKTLHNTGRCCGLVKIRALIRQFRYKRNLKKNKERERVGPGRKRFGT
jgi:hypothetical protein